MDTKLENIAEAIKAVVEKQLAPATVTEVHLNGDLDHDGDPILRIQVVFEAENGELDPIRVKGLIRHLREPLNDFAEIGFPVLSFITTEEQAAEAA